MDIHNMCNLRMDIHEVCNKNADVISVQILRKRLGSLAVYTLLLKPIKDIFQCYDRLWPSAQGRGLLDILMVYILVFVVAEGTDRKSVV